MPSITTVRRNSSWRPSAQSRSAERWASLTISRRTVRRTSGESAGSPSAWERFVASRRRLPARAAHSHVPPNVARRCATPGGIRLPDQAAPSITRPSTRAAIGPRAKGASGRGAPSGASASASRRRRR